MTDIRISTDANVHRLWVIYAHRKQMTLAGFIRMAVQHYIDSQPKPTNTDAELARMLEEGK